MALPRIHNERAILAQISLGDSKAFTLIFDTYYQPLGEYIFRITESQTLSEEILQDTFMKLWETRERLSEVQNIASYLFILSRNKTLNYLRDAAKIPQGYKQWWDEHGEDAYFMDRASPMEEYTTIIDKAVSNLPTQQRRVYLLSREERLKYHEIAQRMGLSRETVKKHMQLALGFLKRTVKSEIEQSALGLLFISLF